MKMINVAVVGATGTVGKVMLEILSHSHLPIQTVYALASARSHGEAVSFQDKTLIVQDLAYFDFSKVQIAFFSAGATVSSQYAVKAANAGCIVIDNTSFFRNDDDIPLVVPEVNSQDIAKFKNRKIIANPNCSTIQMLVALKPIYDAVGITRINVVTYQSVSGSGRLAIEELTRQTQEIMNGLPISNEVYPIQIAFNVIPHIDSFEPNGYTREEMKMVRETKKILGDNDILVNATAVRVPVLVGHSQAIHIETKQKLTAEQARKLLEKAPGIIVKDNPHCNEYPSPLVDAAGRDAVFVGRIREDISHPLGLNLWVVADNIRKGAALNSIQIAQILVSDYWSTYS